MENHQLNQHLGRKDYYFLHVHILIIKAKVVQLLWQLLT